MLDLQAFPLRFRQPLVVRHFQHEGADLQSEKCLQLLRGGLRVFDGIVKNGSQQRRQVCHATYSGKERGDLDRVVDVGRGVDILAPLSTVLVSSKPQRFQELGDFGNTALPSDRCVESWVTS